MYTCMSMQAERTCLCALLFIPHSFGRRVETALSYTESKQQWPLCNLRLSVPIWSNNHKVLLIQWSYCYHVCANVWIKARPRNGNWGQQQQCNLQSVWWIKITFKKVQHECDRELTWLLHSGYRVHFLLSPSSGKLRSPHCGCWRWT